MLNSGSVHNTPSNSFIPRAVINACLNNEKLNISHINVQSLCARQFTKFNELKMSFIDNKIDIICMTETWLSDKITDSMIEIDNFQLVRNDRNRQGGGICVYYRKNLNCRIVSKSISSPYFHTTEFLLLEMQCGLNKFLLGVYYNPPTSDCSGLLASHFEEYNIKYDSTFFIGDFNTNLMKDSNKSRSFRDVLERKSFVCINDEPTFFHNTGCSQLDLLLTDSPQLIIKNDQISMPGVSSHDMIIASLDIDFNSEKILFIIEITITLMRQLCVIPFFLSTGTLFCV